MKLFCFVVLIFFNSAAFGQIEYTPVLDIDANAAWKIKDQSGKVYLFDPLEHSAFDLPDTGTYVLSMLYGELEPMEIRVTADKQVDTFFHPHLEIPLIISNPPPTRYRFYGEIADGYCADFYSKGKLRREGTFKNGDPVDTVKTYYFSGELKELDIPIVGGKIYVDYYRNGQVKREYNTKNHEDKEYYPSGQLSYYRQYKNRKTVEEEYYENGQLKRSQKKKKEVRYSSNGLKTDILRKRLVSGYFSRRYKTYDFTWESYNFQGLMQSRIAFTVHDSYPRYPKDKASIERSSIREAVLFEEGSPIKKIVVDYEYINQEFVYRTTSFERENNKWVKKNTGTLHHLGEFL